MLRRQQQGYAPPYEVWRYSRGKGNYYIFADRTGVGGFKLMSSNDVKEVGDPNGRGSWGCRAGGHRPVPESGPDRAGPGAGCNRTGANAIAGVRVFSFLS